jgi:hypothetical protein
MGKIMNNDGDDGDDVSLLKGQKIVRDAVLPFRCQRKNCYFAASEKIIACRI